MTSICYPDCEASSPGGRFLLEARSPDNGAMPYPDGTSAAARSFQFEYRQHQGNFRYRLLDKDSGVVVWERHQADSEDSPHELIVSDEGWSILRTHGFSPELIAVDPLGCDALRVRILGPKDDEDHPEPERIGASTPVSAAWHAEGMALTTAGMYWAGNSWRSFFRHAGRAHFAWRAWWGRRLVIDLENGTLVTEGWQSQPELARAVVTEESRGVRALLAELAPRMGEIPDLLRSEYEAARKHPLCEKVTFARAALHLVGVHGLRDCVPFLRDWEHVDSRASSTGCPALGRGWSMESPWYRPLVHHALRLLDEEPQGLATYHFRQSDRGRLAIPERIADRRARALRLRRNRSARQVLDLLGSPDHVTRAAIADGTPYRWTENWEYDFRTSAGWVTLTIFWEETRMARVNEAPSDWPHGNRREVEILRSF